MFANIPRGGPARGGRFQMTNATMVDLVARAYGFAADKVLGGPSWLEMDRFDVSAKIPPDTTPDDQKLMLQSLLEDRFKLKAHKETKPLPSFALVVGKKPLMKQADGEGETGCKLDSGGSGGGAPGEGGMVLNSMGADGKATTIRLGPGMILDYHCRNMSMAAFAEGLRGMMGAFQTVGNNPLLNETGLEGRWNFDVKWSLTFIGPAMGNGEHISVSDALEKQLGLKLETRQVPTPVIVVDSVNRKPTDNPPGVSEALPPVSVPTSFEVADVKPAGPGRMGGLRFMPGGRLSATGTPMSVILMRAFGSFNSDELVNVPTWADSERFDITAKAQSADPAAPPIDIFSAGPLIRSLLVERFGLKYHEEQRPLPAYSLVAAKPKMKKADPDSRTWCRSPNAPAGAPPGTMVLNCQNTTMAEFAERLQNASPELNWPVLDATGLEGGWDLTLTYTRSFPAMMAMGPGRGGGESGGPGGDLPSASDPTGGITLFQAIEKQLGLKLELQKRPEPVFVIDHLEQKPTDN
jgi:uncharacterized protein (TIGR03435 family)